MSWPLFDLTFCVGVLFLEVCLRGAQRKAGSISAKCYFSVGTEIKTPVGQLVMMAVFAGRVKPRILKHRLSALPYHKTTP